MATHDDYIKARDPVGSVPVPQDDAALRVTEDQALETAYALETMDWSKGLTRDQIKRKYRELPLGIYLRLPDSKRFTSPAEVLREAGVAASRAEGDFLGANPNLPSEESISDGGPPDWGQQPAVYPARASVEGGSAEDVEGLLPSDEPEAAESIGGDEPE
jgi:hypothetical protein